MYEIVNLLCSKKSDLGNVAVAKIKKLTSELEELDSNKSSDAVERLKSGFIHFKTHNYEYVIFLFPYGSVQFSILVNMDKTPPFFPHTRIIIVLIKLSPHFNLSLTKGNKTENGFFKVTELFLNMLLIK